jgi:uncharacterized protein YndB with AHSA1/START domain
MSETSTSHHTIEIKRTYPVASSAVFAAWRDPAALARWYLPGDASWSSRVEVHEFRVGGRKLLHFGPRGAAPYFEDCRYEDIVDGRRLCYSMTIGQEQRRISTSMVTVVLVPRGRSTDVIVTDQLVILDGADGAAERERGWGETLDKLTGELRGG